MRFSTAGYTYRVYYGTNSGGSVKVEGANGKPGSKPKESLTNCPVLNGNLAGSLRSLID